MKAINFTNAVSGISHTITFHERPSASGKISIHLDGRSCGQINKASGAILANREDVYNAIKSAI